MSGPQPAAGPPPSPNPRGATSGLHRGFALALVAASLSVAAAVVQDRRQQPRVRYDRFQLPAFDAYVYVAMADDPAFFSVAPWGHRILTPWLVRSSPGNVVRGFRYVTVAGLSAAGFLLYLFLRRLGHGPVPSLLAVAAFHFSPPVADVARYRFLNEPLMLALVIGFLVALEAGAPAAVLAGLAALGALTKDASLFVLLAPAAYLVRTRRDGRAGGLTAAAATAATALAVAVVLRAWWTPHLSPVRPELGVDLVRSGFTVLRETWSDTWPAVLVAGVTPLALVGAVRPSARPFLRSYGYLAAATLVLPFVAWIQVPAQRPVPLFGPNVLRLMAYSLPFLLPLALTALDRIWPLSTPPPASRRWPGAVAVAGATVAVAGLAFPLLALDRYRRIDMQGPRDGPLVLAVCRETLRTANRIERGLTVGFDPDRYRFVWGVSDPGELARMRWFLRKGWGDLAHYGTGSITMQEPSASLLLPLFRPRALDVVLALEADRPLRVDVAVNDRPLGRWAVDAGGVEAAFRVPAGTLIRGDNLLTLTRTPADTAGPRVRRYAVTAAER